MTKLGIGILGVGAMGKQNAYNIRRLIPEAQLVAVADVDLKRAEQVASELEIEHSYNSVEAAAERSYREGRAVAVQNRTRASRAAC